MPCECGAERWVACDRRVPNAVDRGQRLAHRDGVQAAPLSRDEYPGVDLQVQVPVRVSGSRGVVPRHCRLQALDRNGDLPTARADPSRHMLREPAEYFPGGASLRTLMGGRHVRVELGD